MDRRTFVVGIATLSTGCVGEKTKNNPESEPIFKYSSGNEEGWKHYYHDNEGESVCYDNGKVFSGSKDGTIAAARATDGQLLWQVDVHERFPKSLVTTEFTRDLDATENVLYSAGRNGEVVAFDAEDGSELWTHNHHDDSVWEVHCIDGIVYTSGRDAKVIAADASTGSFLWSHTAHQVDGDPSNEMIRTVYCSNNAVYSSGFDGQIVAADPESGDILWTYDFGHSIKSVHKSDTTVFFAPWTRDVDDDVIGIHEETLEQVGSHSHHDQEAEGFRDPHTGVEELYVTEGILLTAGDDGKLVAADNSDMALLFEHEKHDSSVRSIDSDGNYVYSTARDGVVIKYPLENTQ